MHADATTLSDLEVFRDGGNRGGVFALLDETQTEEGSKALRRRLEQPHTDARSIRETQQAVQFFAAHPGVVQIREGVTRSLRRYLDSNIAVGARTGPPATSLNALWFSLRYGDLYSELKAGVASSDELVETLLRSTVELLSLSPPPLVSSLAEDLLVCCERCAASSIPGSAATVLARDHFLRGRGRQSLLDLTNRFGELDALRSMGRAMRRMGWTMPEIVESDQFFFQGEGIYHPFLTDGVTNPIDVTGGEPMVFLTGPNMAGKTTYLRAVGLVVLLAQAGMAVPAERVRVTPVDVLFTSLNPSDNLRAGLSYFLSEVLRVRDAATLLADGKRCFVLFDEVFKGTNVKDALEASATVIRGFARARGSGFIFSSHLIELVDVLRADGRVRFYSFDGELVDGRAEYSYRMREGVSDRRLGLFLLREARIPDLIARIGG
jgi:DNA mismatch repair ATPase MutS